MQMRYLLWNPGSVPVRVGEDILLPAGGYSSKIFDRDEIDYLQAELHDKHIRICRIAPMGPDGHRLRRRQPAETSVVEPSFRQRELYKKLTGQELAGDVDRIEASRRIELAMTARNSAAEWDSSFAEQAVSAQPDGSVEVLMNRLFISVSPSFPEVTGRNHCARQFIGHAYRNLRSDCHPESSSRRRSRCDALGRRCPALRCQH